MQGIRSVEWIRERLIFQELSSIRLGRAFALAGSSISSWQNLRNNFHGSLTSGLNDFLDILEKVGLDFVGIQFHHLDLRGSVHQRLLFFLDRFANMPKLPA